MLIKLDFEAFQGLDWLCSKSHKKTKVEVRHADAQTDITFK